MSEISKEILTDDLKLQITDIIQKYSNQEGALINVLHETQHVLGYIPYEVQKFVSEKMNIPVSEVYGVVTFYSRFTLEPVGKYKIGVCMGTACYVRGSDKVLDRVQSILKLKAGKTSEDGLYSIEATRCIGACGLAPVITVNEDVYGKLAAEDVDAILAKYN